MAEVERGRPHDIVVFMIRRDTVCSECSRELGKGNLLRLENEKALCIDCADLGHLEFLSPGRCSHHASRRQALKAVAVVVEWSRPRALRAP